MGVVFAKTRKGLDEIASRSGGLKPRERRLLIFIDGKRPLDELQRMLQADDLRPPLENCSIAATSSRLLPTASPWRARRRPR